MKEFGDWLGDLTRELQAKEEGKNEPNMEDGPQEYDPILGEYFPCSQSFYEEAHFNRTEHCWEAECRGCGRMSEIHCDPTEFILDEHWGGCGPGCIP